ncbi:hypothetical protein HMPREF9470_05296 [[Clostridium] citroniae WAL-19142]|uniref:Uncharacterized protein n=1 Tax=[Clostridium] citroniae WAL-19142 TaxID=742734 RepID=A0A0J9BK87_9FIRM|nr:hypothetical protein HMPREF9470_05296 [[Clostridium] citroniae WAL-19142]
MTSKRPCFPVDQQSVVSIRGEYLCGRIFQEGHTGALPYIRCLFQRKAHKGRWFMV